MRKKLLFVLSGIFGIVIFYFSGPQAGAPNIDLEIPSIDIKMEQLEAYVHYNDSNPLIKPDNESRIIWADSNKEKTEYCLLYLPGFTATYKEGDPIIFDFAERYGCNAYIPRIRKFGLNDDDVLIDLTVQDMVGSATEALAIARKLGNKVIIMSCSTGGTLSLLLASEHPEIHGLVMYSPNIALRDPAAFLLDGPWGLQVARLVLGGKYYIYEESEEFQKYWYTKYRAEGLVALESMLENYMTSETFKKVKQPSFIAYYYRNEDEQDELVSVEAIKKMYVELGTPEEKKHLVSMSSTGNHIMASYLKSEDIEGLENETFSFAEEYLGLRPKIFQVSE